MLDDDCLSLSETANVKQVMLLLDVCHFKNTPASLKVKEEWNVHAVGLETSSANQLQPQQSTTVRSDAPPSFDRMSGDSGAKHHFLSHCSHNEPADFYKTHGVLNGGTGQTLSVVTDSTAVAAAAALLWCINS